MYRTWVWVNTLYHLFLFGYSSDTRNARLYLVSSSILSDSDCIVLVWVYGAIWAISYCLSDGIVIWLVVNSSFYLFVFCLFVYVEVLRGDDFGALVASREQAILSVPND